MLGAMINTDTLLVRQLRTMLSNEFTITDAAGTPAATVHTEGGAFKRLFRSARLRIKDVSGADLLKIHDPLNIFKDRIDFFDPEETKVAHLSKDFTLLRPAYTLHAYGQTYTISGKFWEFEYRIEHEGRVIATIDRSFDNLGNFLMNKDTYAIQFRQPLTPELKTVIVGAAVAIDRMNEKRDTSLLFANT